MSEQHSRARSGSRKSNSLVERYREYLFNGLLVVGMICIAFGFAFFLLALSMDTTPPAPYFQSFTDRILTFVAAMAIFGVGASLLRVVRRLGGW